MTYHWWCTCTLWRWSFCSDCCWLCLVIREELPPLFLVSKQQVHARILQCSKQNNQFQCGQQYEFVKGFACGWIIRSPIYHRCVGKRRGRNIGSKTKRDDNCRLFRFCFRYSILFYTFWLNIVAQLWILSRYNTVSILDTQSNLLWLCWSKQLDHSLACSNQFIYYQGHSKHQLIPFIEDKLSSNSCKPDRSIVEELCKRDFTTSIW